MGWGPSAKPGIPNTSDAPPGPGFLILGCKHTINSFPALLHIKNLLLVLLGDLI